MKIKEILQNQHPVKVSLIPDSSSTLENTVITIRGGASLEKKQNSISYHKGNQSFLEKIQPQTSLFSLQNTPRIHHHHTGSAILPGSVLSQFRSRKNSSDNSPSQKKRLKARLKMDQTHRIFLQEIVSVHHLFKKQIIINNIDEAIFLLTELFIIAINRDDIDLFIDVYKLVAVTYSCFGRWSEAMMVLDQIKFICDLTRRFQDKVWVFNQLAKICKRLGIIDKATIFIKKGLQYSWYLDNKELELNQYEELGIIAYLNYEIENGRIFHDRAMKGLFEPSNSILKSISKKDIGQYIGSLMSHQIDHIDATLLKHLYGFPIKLVPLNNDDTYTFSPLQITNQYLISEKLRCVRNKGFTFIKIDPFNELMEILKHDDFKYEFPSPIAQNFQGGQFHDPNKTNKESFGHDPFRRKLLMQQGQIGIRNQERRMTPQQLIKKRLNMKFDIQKIFDKVYNVNQFQGNKNTVLKLTHLTLNRNLDNFDHTEREVLKFADEIFKSRYLSLKFLSK